MAFFSWQDQNSTLVLCCHLQPKAKKDEFCGKYGDSLKIRITAPPVDGKANQHLIKFLAKSFGVKQNEIEILSGETSREKRIAIKNPNKIPKILEITSSYTS
jgi:uncharacterized protein (TIGR00251 family)